MWLADVRRSLRPEDRGQVQGVTAEGWAWVQWSHDLPHHWSYSWQKLPGKKKASAEDKAKSGVVLQFMRDGTLDITYGVMKPAAAKAAAKKAAAKKGEAPPVASISNSMAQRLSVTIAHAARKAIATNPHTALAAVLAGLGSSGYGRPIIVRAEGNVRAGRDRDFESLLRAIVR